MYIVFLLPLYIGLGVQSHGRDDACFVSFLRVDCMSTTALGALAFADMRNCSIEKVVEAHT
jgi:hypothetical protein